jgi:hypothetical protein
MKKNEKIRKRNIVIETNKLNKGEEGRLLH